MIYYALTALSGFFLGVAVMAGYGYAVAFLTLVKEERQASPAGGSEP